jgi:DNA-3-methyladenine glycosylase II
VPTLTLPDPYDFVRSTERYRAFGPDLANLWHEGGVHRVFEGQEVRIEAASGGVDVEPFESRVHHYLGGPFDLDGFYAFAQSDPVLARIVRELRGLRPPLNPDPYETLVTSITAQQVSLRSAFAVRNRLIERFGVRAEHAWAFPSEERMASADENELTEIGFSRRKAEYVVGVARAAVDWDELATLPDDELKTRLVALRGLGEWTADWFLARHLARPRAWPAGDLGVRKAVSAFYGDGRNLTTEEVRTMGERFDPFQNLTAHYFLAALAGGAAT